MNKNCVFRTDMADERIDMYKKVNNLSEIEGISVSTNKGKCFTTTTVCVLNDEAGQKISKKVGKYITVEIEKMNYLDDDDKQNIVNEISKIIKEMIENIKKSVIVVGLGNVNITPDSLGPKVIENIEVTRHLLKLVEEITSKNTREVSAIAPGVLGTTGIETSEVISSVVKKINVDMVIAIDSLATQSISRLGNTIQISDTGITPGSSIVNKKEGINKECLGIPVIAIGVPTVVDMATITNEALDKMSKNVNEGGKFSDSTKEERYSVIAKVLDTENYMVTPKDIDSVIDTVSNIISKGINKSLQEE